jgi:hypothetical protein
MLAEIILMVLIMLPVAVAEQERQAVMVAHHWVEQAVLDLLVHCLALAFIMQAAVADM